MNFVGDKRKADDISSSEKIDTNQHLIFRVGSDKEFFAIDKNGWPISPGEAEEAGIETYETSYYDIKDKKKLTIIFCCQICICNLNSSGADKTNMTIDDYLSPSGGVGGHISGWLDATYLTTPATIAKTYFSNTYLNLGKEERNFYFCLFDEPSSVDNNNQVSRPFNSRLSTQNKMSRLYPGRFRHYLEKFPNHYLGKNVVVRKRDFSDITLGTDGEAPTHVTAIQASEPQSWPIPKDGVVECARLGSLMTPPNNAEINFVGNRLFPVIKLFNVQVSEDGNFVPTNDLDIYGDIFIQYGKYLIETWNRIIPIIQNFPMLFQSISRVICYHRTNDAELITRAVEKEKRKEKLNVKEKRKEKPRKRKHAKEEN